ncbi:unnamed protein product [Spirodela intermedia]|uniref:Uncharacterized protein n=1 Tax=Spirodela intermedia TaxID=51605 RepID=A0A7I8KV12_SPIIN|nr:unnamed protein product [Spirodela intermedia]
MYLRRCTSTSVRSVDHPFPGSVTTPTHRSLSTSEIYKANVKINRLVRDGKIDAARKLFDEMPERDVVSWNTMIAAHYRRSDFDKSKRLFQLMPEKSIVSWNSMISASIQNGDIEEAFDYFRKMPKRNVASWNAMISGLVRYDRLDEAERLFREMPRRNVISYTALVDGLCRSGNIQRARCLFDKMQKNSVSWAVMISGYVQNDLFDEARNVFHQMPEKSVVAITAMMTGYCKDGRVDDARKLFEDMHGKDLVSWNAMMSGYANNGRGEEALRLYIKMLQLGMKQDHSTLLILLTACSVVSSIQSGRQIHAISVKNGFESDLSICNTCITMYSKCGSLIDSDLIFRRIQAPDLVSWNTIIAAFGQHGLYEKARTMFHNLIANGFRPDNVTFLNILSACGHAGKVNDSILWFNIMVFEYQISPKTEHFSCLVDIAGRAGQLDRACEVINKMPFEADSAVWSALLGACQACLNIELAELVAKRLVEINPQDSGAYVMLSNIYAATRNWRDVMRVRSLMKKHGVQKQPGYSWTEVADTVHVFLGGDTSHPDIKRIHSELGILHLHMIWGNVEFTEYITC